MWFFFVVENSTHTTSTVILGASGITSAVIVIVGCHYATFKVGINQIRMRLTRSVEFIPHIRHFPNYISVLPQSNRIFSLFYLYSCMQIRAFLTRSHAEKYSTSKKDPINISICDGIHILEKRTRTHFMLSRLPLHSIFPSRLDPLSYTHIHLNTLKSIQSLRLRKVFEN